MKTKDLILAIKRHDEGGGVIHIEVAMSKGLAALDIIHLLNDLMEELAVLYKLPAQFISGVIHAGMGGDAIERPGEEELESINKLLKEIQEEIENELHEQI